jgi:hypothetical protein
VDEAYVDAGDASTLEQAQAAADSGDAETLDAARTYTDTRTSYAIDTANAYTDARLEALNADVEQLRSDVWNRFDQQDQRIDRMGAMGAAMLNMATNAAGSRSANGRIAVGAGWQNGKSALSVGYARPIGDRASFSIGGAFSGSDQSAGVGFGLDL